MLKYTITLIMFILSTPIVNGQTYKVVVADSTTHISLPNASIFDRNGTPLCMSNSNGRIPPISPNNFPITVSYIGFKDKTVSTISSDTIFLQEDISELPEVVVESRIHKVLHILAYVREYSSLTTYSDTVFLFREKMVDYMLNPDKKVKFKGWSNPRVLTCKSYYKFTNSSGLDSVSDVSRHHFSWSDWIGIAPAMKQPKTLAILDCGTDTLRGKYGLAEIWTKNNNQIIVDVDVLADTIGRKWVPNLSGFFQRDLDFERFKAHFNYDNIAGDTISPLDLSGYSFTIESNGRGHDMFRFNHPNEPFFVSTHADMYILDKEYITLKEARNWTNRKFNTDEIGIYEPSDAPELDSSILALIERVNNIDKEGVRLEVEPDARMISTTNSRKNFRIWNRALFILKQVTGISSYQSRRNTNRRWNEFINKQKHINNPSKEESISKKKDTKKVLEP